MADWFFMAHPPPHHPVHKRIIVCCDGTWQDGVIQKHRWQYSNILKMSRALNHQDDRTTPPTPQIVFYQTGVGSQNNIYSEYIEGATGADLGDKVQEAYAFIAHNYQPGDEIFLFGFSRGAYTARMVADFIGRIGVLDKKDMDRFADIFIAYQKRGNTQDHKERQQYDMQLLNYKDVMDNGRRRADIDGDGFSIRCIGVFDTVGSVGLPKEITFWSKTFKELFGFSDRKLGLHIERAYHAMALNETRKDFDVAKYEQRPEGLTKGQVLKQVWFAGSHSDIGGGWMRHDLSDLTLTWMISNVEDILSIDRDYLYSLPQPVAPWGEQFPHDPQTGIFKLAFEIQRSLPTETDNITHEYIHPSVQQQKIQIPQLMENIAKNPALVCDLHDVEERMKKAWNYIPKQVDHDESESDLEDESQDAMLKNLRKMAKRAARDEMEKEVMEDEGGRPRYQETWFGSIIHELFGNGKHSEKESES